MDEMDLTARTEAERRQATYEKIKKYVAEHNDGMKVSNLYIAQVKAKYGVFLNMHNLVTIDKLIVSDTGSVAFSDTFGTCEKLQNITVEGVIGQNVNLSLCPLLTHDSIINIISCLQDLTGTGNTRTLTLGATNLAKLTDAEKAVATEKGWTLA